MMITTLLLCTIAAVAAFASLNAAVRYGMFIAQHGLRGSASLLIEMWLFQTAAAALLIFALKQGAAQ